MAITLIASYSLTAQVAVTTDGSSADASAMLDVKSTDKGMLLPSMTATQRNAISSPAIGLLVFVTDDNNFYFYNGAAWTQFSGGGNPAGTIVAFGGSTVPDGWLLCDGSEVSRTVYPNLYNAITANWGAGNGTTTFHLPDLRGRFLRGTDHGAGIDPDAASRTAQSTLGNSGDNVGSVQDDAYKNHDHSVDPPNTSTNTTGNHRHRQGGFTNGYGSQYLPAGSYNPSGSPDEFDSNIMNSGEGGETLPYTGYVGDHSHTVNISAFNSASSGNNETRPTNVYVDYIIKY